MTATTATRLYLARHCDVENPEHVLYGHLPGFGLSRKGIAQAHAMGRFLAATPVRQIYTSPLERATQTAGIVASYLHDVPVETTPDLTEARFGLYVQGVHPRDIPWRRPLWWVHMVWPGLLPNDESVADMAERVQRQLLRLLRDHPGDGGVCISHGDPIQAFWVQADGRPPYALHRLQCAKGGMLVLDYDGTNLRNLEYWAPDRIAAATALPEADASHV